MSAQVSPTDDTRERMTLLREWVSDPRNAYAVRAKGDGFLAALIHDGDVIVCERVTEAQDGWLVHAWVKATQTHIIRRWHAQANGTIELRAEVDAAPPLMFARADLELRGRVAGIVRNLEQPKPTPAAPRKARTPQAKAASALFDTRGTR